MKNDEITLKNHRLDLISSFKNHLVEEHEKDLARYYNDDYGYDYGLGPLFSNNEVYRQYRKAIHKLESTSKKLYGSHTRRSGKKNKRNYSTSARVNKRNRSRTMFDDTYDVLNENKMIYYYPDYSNPYDVKEFENLYDFDIFLDEEGVSVPESEVSNLQSRVVSHCCIDPKGRANGELILKTDRSYGDLRYECAESEEELADYE